MINLIPYYKVQQNERKATRDGFGEALVELGERDEKVIALCDDLNESLRMHTFAEKFPDRFFNVGIAEQNMVGIAAGLAMEGMIPFVGAYATFLGRAWDQIRVSVCLPKLNVKLIGSHGGLSVGADGATAQALEDIAMLRALPNLTIVVPCDAVEARKATVAAQELVGPMYIRLSRPPTPIFTTEKTPFVVGRAEIFRDGKDVTIISCGPMMEVAMGAAEKLSESKVDVRVVNMHTIKPIDVAMIKQCAKETGAIVTIEDHQIIGGLGGAVAEVLVQHAPVPMEMIGVRGQFGESGTAEELYKIHHMVARDVEKAVEKVLLRKKRSHEK